ncbi:MAG: serine kinase [Rhodopseudomonas sp.]|nr:serine kinase [Rhodopseudomonas sp.]
MTHAHPTVHASAVLVGAKAVLIRGPSGAGKSRLCFDLIQAAAQGSIPFARLVADDRALLEACHGRLLVRPAPSLAGLIEVRGLGIRVSKFEPVGVVDLVVDLAAADAARLPTQQSGIVELCGIRLARLPVAADADALPAILARLSTTDGTARPDD